MATEPQLEAARKAIRELREEKPSIKERDAYERVCVTREQFRDLWIEERHPPKKKAETPKKTDADKK